MELVSLNGPTSPMEDLFWEAVPNKSKRYILRQHVIGFFQVDFAYIPKSGSFMHAPTVIEIDGHDGHKSKEQRTSDAFRERCLLTMGWDVVRFTGSEVHSNASKCWRQVECIIFKRGVSVFDHYSNGFNDGQSNFAGGCPFRAKSVDDNPPQCNYLPET